MCFVASLYRDTSLIRNNAPLGPYSRIMPRAQVERENTLMPLGQKMSPEIQAKTDRNDGVILHYLDNICV